MITLGERTKKNKAHANIEDTHGEVYRRSVQVYIKELNYA